MIELADLKYPESAAFQLPRPSASGALARISKWIIEFWNCCGSE